MTENTPPTARLGYMARIQLPVFADGSQCLVGKNERFYA